jgi:hypothetical protein
MSSFDLAIMTTADLVTVTGGVTDREGNPNDASVQLVSGGHPENRDFEGHGDSVMWLERDRRRQWSLDGYGSSYVRLSSRPAR